MKKNIIGIIPARYASSRFPGKPLVRIGNKTLIEHVYERVKNSGIHRIAVATEDSRIAECVSAFGGIAIMTSPNHLSGTDRCREAAEFFNPEDSDIIVNIQGDEPMISSKELSLISSAFDESTVVIATLANPSFNKFEVTNPNVVKVVKTKNGNALYFSRYAIPFLREDSSSKPCYLRHIGIYAYRFKTLKEITMLQPSELELCEKLEQLRWLENGYPIKVLESNYEGIGVDTPEDLKKITNLLI